MRGRLLLRSVLVAVLAVIAGMLATGAQAAPPPQDQAQTQLKGEGITAAEFKEMTTPKTILAAAKLQQAMEPPPGGWDVPSDRAYHLDASCQGQGGVIGQGAAAWKGLNETSGEDTPVECRNSYITDCGGGGNIVGCNWGQGQRIALYLGGVGDQALLAAHEFGHDWYGHSSYQCAGWGSPEEVMAPSICTLNKKKERID
ncbi:hypothetical protein [Streptomyces sp. NPDC048172]|uniref:hypothetical protein n=1 Tax=Streptomyces sp. NPDC048172 TaxID=3365505 RepID=UPI003724309A